ncbi:GDP-mannose-dependent alpha-(1-6)-phosphatidylinositol monomannoside mannosyltransferase [Phycisphaerae bacterium RAS1]|nr:GDP-mannose-dependent alpha-(1-6)-phosphatidylinositol monomannoside mannosyltransferase [Phycisphaerae bacterium RAS1]
MRVALLIAGAANMYCGSCLRDNRLAATLRRAGRDVVALPLYTPIRTDETAVTESRVYFGGVGVYVRQRWPLLAKLPGVAALLNWGPALKMASRLAGATRAEQLGPLTLSVLRGEQGEQRAALRELVEGLRRLRPAVVNLPNLLFIGVAAELRRALGVKVVCSLSGEDLFVDALPEPWRPRAMAEISRRSADVDAYVAMTQYYAGHAAAQFGLPRERIHHVPLGVAVEDFAPAATRDASRPFTLGYLARICPEKGVGALIDAFLRLRREGRRARLRIAGYLGASDRAYFDQQLAKAAAAGARDEIDVVGEVTREQKAAFLRSLDLFSVPSVYHESKGLYVIEAMAAGVPVVQPRHGSFPELVESCVGGVLYEPNDPVALPSAIATLMDDAPRRAQLGAAGAAAVRAQYSDEIMARRMWQMYETLPAPKA